MAAEEAFERKSEPDGIGIRVAQLFEEEAPDSRGPIVVLEVFPQSAASVAGLLAGDRIAQIGGKATRGMTLEEAVLKYLRAGKGACLQLDLERAKGPTRVEVQIE